MRVCERRLDRDGASDVDVEKGKEVCGGEKLEIYSQKSKRVISNSAGSFELQVHQFLVQQFRCPISDIKGESMGSSTTHSLLLNPTLRCTFRKKWTSCIPMI